MTIINSKEIARFQNFCKKQIEEELKNFKFAESPIDTFLQTQKIQSFAIRMFESSKGSIPEKWLNESLKS